MLCRKILHNTMNLKTNFFTLIFVFFFNITYSQNIGDYRSAGTGNWGTLSTWQRWNGTAWVTPTAAEGYPGQYYSPTNVTIQNGHTITLNVYPSYNLGNLTISGGNAGTAINILNNNELFVSGTTTINAPTANGINKYISVNNGYFYSGNINILISSGNTRDAYIEIGDNGIVEVSQDVNMGNNNLRCYIFFSGNGNLLIGGTILGGGITSTPGGGANPPTFGTVIYNNSASQNIGAYTYYNLTVTNGGVKYLSGNVTVNNVLNIDNGIIDLNGYNLTIGTAGTITGSFNNQRMIRCTGNGNLIKQGTNQSQFVMTYPVGTNNRYTPFEITSFTATVTNPGSISVRAVEGTAPGANPTDLQKYWIINTNNLAAINANVRFTYIIPDEIGIGGDQSTYQPVFYNGTTWVLPSGASSGGVNPMTVTGVTTLTGTWTAREAQITYYSYQSGDWANPLTWTRDPSGTTSVDPAVPGILDRVVILNGRTVFTNTARTVLSLQINEGGTLDIGSTTGHNFGDVRGQGVLRLSTNQFPGGNFTEFVSAGGGTVEYYNSSNFTFNQLTYNNLIVNLTNSNLIATLTANMTVNGNLTITQGRLQINDATNVSRNLIIEGNLYVSSNGSIRLGTGNARHRITIRGDFTNYGSVRFTNQAAPNYTAYPTNGYADVVFDNGTKDQYVSCNGQTDFYRIEINKGFDKTYVLHLDASSPSNFALYGRNDLQHYWPESIGETPGNLSNNNALGLLAGTVRIGNNINIPVLATYVNPYGVYSIDQDACLWIDNGVITYNSQLQWYGPVIYGELRITGTGSFDATNSQNGIVLRGTGLINIEGGLLTTSVLRVSSRDEILTQRGSYRQTGGIVTLTGNNDIGNMATFTLPYPGMGFIMTGGVMNILASTSAAGNGYGFSVIIACDPNNIEVTGGTINVTIPNDRPAYINTSAPIYNLNINSSSNNVSALQVYNGSASSPVIPVIPAQPLVVLNDFTLNGTAIFNANNQNVTIGHNFIINNTATYNPGTNTTTFNGNGGQLFANNGTITNGLNNLTITNRSNTSITQNLTIRNILTIDDSCYLQDMGRTINVAGNIINSGTHVSQATGSITLTGANAQTIGGNGNGIFGNLYINKTGGSVTVTTNQYISGNLRLASNHVLNIGSNRLTLSANSNVYDALTGTTQNFSANKMIQTAGNMSDGGVSKEFSSTAPFLFPVGVSGKYTPYRIQFSSAPESWGTVNVKPVNKYQPFVTSSNSLNYYWKVGSSGFSDIQPNSVSQTFWYVDTDIRGTEANYIPGVYRPYSWSYINDISQVVDANNEIRFWNISQIDGEYTAGELSAFGTVKVYYSRQNGNWNDPNTWSSVSVGGPVDGSIPGASNPVVIGDGNTQNHTVTITTNNVTVGGLEIRQGSVLDLGITTGHNFGALPESKVVGNGTIRISSAGATAQFPAGDFGNFLSAGGGTVEYYTTGATAFTLPAGITFYNNLIISPGNANITLPNIDLTIYSNLSITGTGTGIAMLNSAAARTLTVYQNINVKSGILRFNNNNNNQTVVVYGNIDIDNGAIFDVSTTTNATNILRIYGNLNNNGTFDMYGENAARVTNVYFVGNENKQIAGTGTNEFNYLYVSKGNDRNTILNVTANNLTLRGTGTALILQYGTFRVANPLLNITLSTTSAFTIPSTAALSVYDGTVNIGTNNNNGDLILNGRLEVINNGRVNIGQSGQNFNNDIEYASGGNPEIIVADNGYLFVNGQIRRPTTVSTGSLSYTQSGNSTVIVDGRSAVNTRSMFEILNNGTFNMSGGTLTISRSFNNASYNDLIINPANYSVTGGTIRLGSANIAAGGQINFIASAPLWNLVVDGATNKTANQRVYPITILNNLTIEGNSVYSANGLNVTISGNLVNNNTSAATGINVGGYRPGSINQITTFNGNNTQYIIGNGTNLTNFANLIINKTNSLILDNAHVQVNKDLNLVLGTLNDGENNITVIGNIDNRAVHVSPNTTGGIILNGTLKQVITGSGNGIFGNVQINNSTGVDMKDNTTINGILRFTNGILYIDDYLLTLGENASIAGTPGPSSMIMLNGVISDQGVKKLFPAGTYDFTFPIGVPGKYTPVRYNILSNDAPGSITVVPVNSKHPALYNGGTSNRLDFYWYVTSTGFTNPLVQHTYYYNNSDVNGDENTYVAGRYYQYQWTPTYLPSDNSINAANNTINILPSVAVNYIDGEYTAGDQPNFTNLPIYYSRNATLGGNWTDPNSWTLNSDGSGGPAPSYPQGNPVVILPGHTITMNANSQFAYSVEVNGTLDINTTLYHNLGFIKGGGTIKITSTTPGTYGVFVFPGGDYDEFMANTSSTIELHNNNTTVPAYLPLKPGNDYKPYQNVIFSGAGIKYISAENIKVLGNLTIQGGTLDNTKFNKTVTVNGNWIDNTTGTTGGFVPGTGTVNFSGTNVQSLTITNNTTIEQFYNLNINNPAGVVIGGGGQVNVNNILYLTNGRITTNSTNLLTITNTNPLSVIGGGSASFVNGPLRKNINAGSYFNFPVGDGTRYGNVYISSVSIGGYYVAQYYNRNPGADGMDPNSKVNPIDVVSNNEYWRVNGPAGATGYVRIRWDSQSGIIPSDASSRTKLRIVEWNGTAWENRGNVINDGGVNYGTIQTSTIVNISGNHYFTIGVESLPTAIIISGDSSICNDGSTTNIVIELTGVAPWTIKYKVNGAYETTVSNIAISPYTLVISNAIEPIASGGPGDYVFNISYVRDATGSTGVRDFTKTVTITVYESPNPVISGNTTAAIGETNVIYSTPYVAGHTYLWSYSGPPGTTHNGSLTNNTLSINWGNQAGTGWVRVTETVTIGGCTKTTDFYYVTITDIPNPEISGPTSVCNFETVVYRTPKVGTHTYLWSLPLGGGTIVGSNTLDSVVVQWTGDGLRRVKVVETGSESREDNLDVTVNPLPPNNYTVSDPSICEGNIADIIVYSTAPGLSLQLRDNSNNNPVGLPVSTGPGGNVTINASPTITTVYNILVTNEYNCSQQLNDLSTVTVYPRPIPTISEGTNICQGETVVYTTESGKTNYIWIVTNVDPVAGHQIISGGGTNDNSITIKWTGYERHRISVSYTDENGCTPYSPTNYDVWVIKLPQTGPIYHLQNSPW